MTSTTVTNPDVSHVVTRSTGHLLRLVVGVNAMWLSLSMLSDGLSTLLLPSYLMGSEEPFGPATMLGLATFAGITAGMIVQPLFGALSDNLRPQWGRRGLLSIGTLILISALSGFLLTRFILFVILTYLVVQISLSATQAALQGFIPDLIPRPWRIRATGEPRGEYPPEPLVIPVYGIRYLLIVGAVVAALAILWRVIRRFTLR